MKLLITGGSGFIGSALIRHLIAETETCVVSLDKLTYAAPPGALATVEGHPRYAFERADICDAADVRRIFAEHRPDAVMHLAAESHVDRSIDSPAAFIETNVLGTWRLLEAALDHWRALDGAARESFRFHHVSTDEVFGSLGSEGAFTEETPYQPNSPYSATKAASDHLVRAWHHTFGLPVVTSNCSNNYGPFQFPEKLIPLMTINALLGKPLPVYGTGDNRRDWLHVEDHARALWTVLTRGRIGETYNIGGEAERTNLTVVETICDLVDALAPRPGAPPRRELIEFVPDRPGHDLRYAIDPTKVRRELGWRPRESFESCLRSTVAWYLDNRAWWQAIRAGRYDGGRLGLGAPAPVEATPPRGAGLLVLGAGGQLGRALARAATAAGIDCRALDHAALDIADRAAVRDALADGSFDLAVNAAAYTAVDAAESEPDLAFVINAGAPGALAADCAARGLPLLQVSTDYVFDGTKTGPYRETDAPNPLSAYGRSKLAGEKAVRSANPRHVVLRTAWLYAAQGANFLNTMLRLAEEREALAVVDDQRGSPTAAAELAGAILAVHRALGREPWGTFHFCSAGETTWYGFARAIFEQRASLTGTPPPRLSAIPTADYPTPARRPANSVLDCSRFVETFGHAPRPWQDALSDVLAERLAEPERPAREVRA